MVCHVLRYTPFYSRVKQLIDEGVLGDIVTIVHTEGLGNIHQSHSFVRGTGATRPKAISCCWPSPATTSTCCNG